MLYSCCLTCNKWQGTKNSTWGDCHYFIGELMPQLTEHKNLFGWNLELPFDPHDVKYFEGLNDDIKAFFKTFDGMDGVRVLVKPEIDLRFILDMYDGDIVRDYQGLPMIKGEREASVTLHHIQTHKMMKGCEFYERDAK